MAAFQNNIDFKGGIEIDGGAALEFAWSGTSPITNDNVISGDGGVHMSGTGEVGLSGDNTCKGGTIITDGTLVALNATALGTGEVGTSGAGLLKLDFTGEFLNDISGTGNIEAAGDGVVINKTTNVAMVVTGTIGGQGTYRSLVVKSGGTLSPSNSPGTITSTNGAKFESGSIYEYEIDTTGPTPASDLLVVTSGEVEIESGAEMLVRLNGGVPADGDSFQVIAASSSQFKDNALFTLTDTWATSFNQTIAPAGYWISWTARTPVFADAVAGYATPNALRAATAMDSVLMAGSESGIQGLYNALSGMSASDPAGLAAAFNQLTGEAYASSRSATTHLSRRFVRLLPSVRNRLMEPISGAGCDGKELQPEKFSTWASIGGDWLDRRNQGSSYRGYELDTKGVGVGMDWLIGSSAFAGLAFGYDDADLEFKRLSAKNELESFRFMAYGGMRWGDWYLDANAGYVNDRHEIKRYIGIGDYRQAARGKYNDDLLTAGFEVGRRFSLGEALLTPNIGLEYQNLRTHGVTAGGAGDANLRLGSGSDNFWQARAGARLVREFRFGQLCWTPEIRAQYAAEVGDDSASVRTAFNTVSEYSFASRSGDTWRHSGIFGVGMELRLNERFAARLDYDYQLQRRASANHVSFSVGVNW